MCLRGVRELQSEWLDQEPSDDVAVYVVWSPQLGAEEQHVPGAAELMPDPRARHYWDPERVVGTAYEAYLGLPEPAWDVWLLFDRDAVWQEDAPEPAWWEHQLGGLPLELRLDPERFARKAAELLATSSAPPSGAATPPPSGAATPPAGAATPPAADTLDSADTGHG